MQHLNIGDAAAAAGVTPKMVRHYESLGLIPQAERTDAGYRLYGEREIAMLRFIRQARSVGFSMQQIEELMSLWRDPDRQSHDVKQVAKRQLEELAERQRELDQMRATLEQMVSKCRGDESAHCVILDHLASAATSQAAGGPIRARRALKEVRPGEKRVAQERRTRMDERKPAAAHVALSAWAHSFTSLSGA
ncbi:Cu(I)-responsive transcriptional regulator [Ramlibacter sp. Leaf400]|uniref:Cu(I)-responsive transcriptional regulator n=1 Tax=Ramlibacter sp. Leaf400 TaxID=1736365 RepID=UPI0009EAA83E|nr:Cu(I)-responsive transcriptional regulator [Ramlibacter sp. Leaf400]